jgi:hypothetical protein
MDRSPDRGRCDLALGARGGSRECIEDGVAEATTPARWMLWRKQRDGTIS